MQFKKVEHYHIFTLCKNKTERKVSVAWRWISERLKRLVENPGKKRMKNKCLNMFNFSGPNPGKTCRWKHGVVANELSGIVLFLWGLVLIAIHTVCWVIVPGNWCYPQIPVPEGCLLLIPQPYLQPRTYSPDTDMQTTYCISISAWMSPKELKFSRPKVRLYHHCPHAPIVLIWTLTSPSTQDRNLGISFKPSSLSPHT